jgi:cytochrome c-type biogenesis protein CcmF
MIAELGHFVLILAFSVAIAQATLPVWALATQKPYGFELAKSAAHLQLVLLAAAFAALTYGFLRSDFSLQIVFGNSHEAKPLVYKFAGVWGNHEGSMLLWILILAAYGAVFAARAKPLPARFATLVLVVQGWLGAAFLAFLIFTSNPFARLFPTPFSGRGLTPILQDPALAAHPPLLYAGYVGFSISFAFAIAVLINKQQGRDWAGWIRL